MMFRFYILRIFRLTLRSERRMRLGGLKKFLQDRRHRKTGMWSLSVSEANRSRSVSTHNNKHYQIRPAKVNTIAVVARFNIPS